MRKVIDVEKLWRRLEGNEELICNDRFYKMEDIDLIIEELSEPDRTEELEERYKFSINERLKLIDHITELEKEIERLLNENKSIAEWNEENLFEIERLKEEKEQLITERIEHLEIIERIRSYIHDTNRKEICKEAYKTIQKIIGEI